MNEAHRVEQERINSKKKTREPFQEGDKVWVRKTPSLSSSAKLEAKWRGPMKITQRRGESSYQVVDVRETFFDVHMDQLKPFVGGDEEQEEMRPMEEDTQRTIYQWEVKGYRRNERGVDEFLVQRCDQPSSEASWLTVQAMKEEGVEIPSCEGCRNRGWFPRIYEQV